MKGKQNGIATAAIAVVVIAVIASVGVGAYLLLRKPPTEEEKPPIAPTKPIAPTGPGGIVVPGGFTQTGQTTVMGYTVTIYAGSGTAAGANISFRTAFEGAGWAFKGEGSFGGYTGTLFEKGNEMAIISAAEVEGQVIVSVAIGPKVAVG